MLISKELPPVEQISRLRNTWDGIELGTNLIWPDLLVDTSLSSYSKFVPESSFSIFTVKGPGSVDVKLKSRNYRICRNTLMLIPPYESFEYRINKGPSVDILNLHLGFNTFKAVFSSQLKSQEELLDKPESEEEFDFLSGYLFHKPLELERFLNQYPNLEHEEFIEETMAWVFKFIKKEKTHQSFINSSKKSTQKELFKRVSIAKDLIFSQYSDPFLTLDKMSSAANLSKFHFIRIFKQAFGSSPYQMIREIRIRKIQEQLSEGENDVTALALKNGFQEPNSIYPILRKRKVRKGGFSNFE
ncbi:helix-turn-helix domain-containing protein [Algoriphagus sp. CAU 1675]|uniref:helix-turn-helix domain-containing protein n=1 Tax=Algoriphagus sp. CAU 1675 TaxID=3032597 RepID=UPI0023DBD438|nr:helix-turn-helix domain-containing protein [Algoriphagus sp. CAU 1675]MDF2159376.1 helix-turn-helix domain-containing protein [Algoriphagus sp. CAU 1675]